MSGTTIRIKRRVWVGLGTGLVGVVLWLWLMRSQTLLPAPPEHGPRPFVQLAGAGTAVSSKILQERAELMDPTPLFFPTEWNYGQRAINESEGRRRRGGEVFGSFEPKLTIPEQNLIPHGVEVPAAPEKPSDVLAQGNEAPFAGMGHIDLHKGALPVRAGYLEVRALNSTENIIEQPLTGFNVSRSDFEPMEFLVVVSASGVVGEPILTKSSGWEEVDTFFRGYLVKSYHVGERLPPGRYVVVVGA